MKEVRIGLIGTGYIGKAHAIAYAGPYGIQPARQAGA